MKKVIPQSDWPESWQYSYTYDLLEIYGNFSDRGYVYAYKNRHQQILSFIQKVAQPGAKILDIAAAQGNFCLSLAELGYNVTWNDLRSELAGYVKSKWEFGQINYQPGNAFELNIKDCFDVVLIAEVIEHVAHPNEFLKKVAQMVKPGGYIVLTTPNGGYLRNALPRFSDFSNTHQFEAIQFQPNADGHIFLLHLDEVQSLAAQVGLEVEEICLFNNPLTNGYLKLGGLLKILPNSVVQMGEKLTGTLSQALQKKIHTHLIALLQRPDTVDGNDK
ncbi:methyltransferase domain-containing protein [Oscillatoria amoena NRMC-F 0135]|nr:methyltransferase domain-containing protein [Geitlerinema splendidum]MDL5046847.1 methyltransferase domain-containing protein [Oscillatoria amoena NRMC-F 0135]